MTQEVANAVEIATANTVAQNSKGSNKNIRRRKQKPLVTLNIYSFNKQEMMALSNLIKHQAGSEVALLRGKMEIGQIQILD